MISFIPSNKMTDRPVFATRPLGAVSGVALASGLGSVNGTGLSFVALPATTSALGNERPTKALAATAAMAQFRAFATETNGAESRTKQYQHHTMWAFRGLEPWRDPA
ncbi:hypothetical protein I5Q34_15785 [Streptomyces sp. AV19]|uniref:hypothetical protein n=1 Tax=Streptomyces sp. AV19 TaxID=2793068 RepID=UPI0018FEDAA0|nr:hypothetical protein [Streptomyces sp. AV19]MBH1935714.1 hypothetical protein [Streptomyces sp. AV19]MDG4536012.1 hypothetical protein [Streptomyces sp. AV19]